MNDETTMQKRYPDSAEAIEQRPAVAPPVDIYENTDELLVIADLPGVSREDLKINLEKNLLRIEGRRRDVGEGEALAAEYRPFDFRRSFAVPQGIDAEHIHAELAQGVLRLHLPKAAAVKPRQIHVKVG